MTIDIIAGARPNFMKIAPIIKAIRQAQHLGVSINFRLIHTGQHYDEKLSSVFFKQLGIPDPDVNFGIGSGTQAEQTAGIMVEFEKDLLAHPADLVVVVGDVTSTMACSIVAKKLNVKLAHVEGGIRSFDMTMPEEINRLVTDALSDYFFTTSEIANENLRNAGVSNSKIFFVGNTMIDTLYQNLDNATPPLFWNEYHLNPFEYAVLTLHRPSNVDDFDVFKNWISYLDSFGIKIIFPIHPRTRTNFNKLEKPPLNIIAVDPLSYFEFIYLIKHAKAVITDSGGVQEETTVLGVPCLTLRNNTERPETVGTGTNVLIGEDRLKLKAALEDIKGGIWKKGAIPDLWDGNTAERIVKIICELNLTSSK
jgi:UDP-N-acetylglucosamine 2-epimerase (non-hydrolysing)